MNFRHAMTAEEPEINLIPLIDVLLVILIFLAVSTSFTRLNQLNVDLPEASAQMLDNKAIDISISEDGSYAVNGLLLTERDVGGITSALRAAAAGQAEPILVISADALSTHEAVIRVLQAAKLAGMSRLNFATRATP